MKAKSRNSYVFPLHVEYVVNTFFVSQWHTTSVLAPGSCTFDIPETINSSFVFLNIYDIKGRMVEKLVEGSMLPGSHYVKWDAKQFSSGVYFVKLTYDNQSRSQKLILLK